jgi:hypothetical protein
VYKSWLVVVAAALLLSSCELVPSSYVVGSSNHCSIVGKYRIDPRLGYSLYQVRANGWIYNYSGDLVTVTKTTICDTVGDYYTLGTAVYYIMPHSRIRIRFTTSDVLVVEDSYGHRSTLNTYMTVGELLPSKDGSFLFQRRAALRGLLQTQAERNSPLHKRLRSQRPRFGPLQPYQRLIY